GFLVAFSVSWLAPWFHEAIQAALPPMRYFRVASRVGLFAPVALGAWIALAWPEIATWLRRAWQSPRGRRWVILFAGLSLLEAGWAFHPVTHQPAMPTQLQDLLSQVKGRPGTR